MTAIKASFDGTVSTYDYYGTGSTINRNTEEGETAVDEAIAYLQAANPATDLVWSSGLFLASTDHVEDITHDLSPTDYGSDGSSPLDRARDYGDYGKYTNHVKQYMYLGRDSALNIVLQMVIDDDDSTRRRRSNIFSTFNTQLGLAQNYHTLYGNSNVFMFGGVEYETDEPYSYCSTPFWAELSTSSASNTPGSATQIATHVIQLLGLTLLVLSN